MQRDVSPSIDVPTKRRKVRKGTKNCWECKRRKVSCIFSEPTNTACDNCIRRKATCIGQEYVAEFETFSNRPVEVEARLGRVEELLERLITNSSEATAPVCQQDIPLVKTLQDSSEINIDLTNRYIRCTTTMRAQHLPLLGLCSHRRVYHNLRERTQLMHTLELRATSLQHGQLRKISTASTNFHMA